ncbi:MAG: hypothetical protein HRU15_15290 [Planctomycetes bacterium]|nr:hypothetical protein [Planctomycetota bacterium]
MQPSELGTELAAKSYAQAGDIIVHGKADQAISVAAGEIVGENVGIHVGKSAQQLRWSAEPWNSAVSVQAQLQALGEAVLTKLELPFPS